MKPSISLIIAFYNDILWLEMILEQLKMQTFKNFEVVIADDGSKAEVVQRINQIKDAYPFPIQHIWHEDLGWRKDIILNKAVVASQADYIVIIDGDCIPHRKFLQDHWDFKQEGTISAGRRVTLPKKISDSLTVEKINNKILSHITLRILWAGIVKEVRHTENIIRIRPIWLRKMFLKQRTHGLLGCNFGIYKSDILKVNGFDERYLAPATGEDTDLEARLNRIGIRAHVHKHVMTQFHKNHPLLMNRWEADNEKILQYNKDNNISFTPWGIDKSSLTDSQ